MIQIGGALVWRGFWSLEGLVFGESNSCKGKEQVQGIKVPCKSLLKPIFHSQLIWELKIFTTSKGLFLEDQFWECSFGSQIRVLFALATPSEGTLIQMSPSWEYPMFDPARDSNQKFRARHLRTHHSAMPPYFRFCESVCDHSRFLVFHRAHVIEHPNEAFQVFLCPLFCLEESWYLVHLPFPSIPAANDCSTRHGEVQVLLRNSSNVFGFSASYVSLLFNYFTQVISSTATPFPQCVCW